MLVKWDKPDVLRVLIFLTTIALLICVNATILYQRYDYLSYYDSSPEFELASLLASENSFLSHNWYYSTEIRVVQTQIVNSILFRFTSSWKAVAVISQIIHTVLLEAAFMLLVHCIYGKIPTGYLFSGLLLVFPFSQVWRMYVIEWMFYTPHFIITFATLCLYIRATDNAKNKRFSFEMVLLGAISFFACLGGVRHLETTVFPLFICSVLYICIADNSRKRRVAFSCIMTLTGGVLGYVINIQVLRRIYVFKNIEDVRLRFLSFSRIEEFANGILQNFGYYSAELASIDGLIALIPLALIILILVLFHRSRPIQTIKSDGSENYRTGIIILFTVVSWIINTFILLMTDTYCEARYHLPQISLLFVCVPVLYQKFEFKHISKKVLCVILLFAIGVLGIHEYTQWYKVDRNNDTLRRISHYVKENDYSIGYGDFYTGNVIPSLTDGAVDYYCIDDFSSFEPVRWLTKSNMQTRKHSPEKAFILLSQSAYDSLDKELDYVRNSEIEEFDGTYVVLKYRSNAELWTYLGDGDSEGNP